MNSPPGSSIPNPHVPFHPGRAVLGHLIRVGVLAAILGLIHIQHQRWVSTLRSSSLEQIPLEQIQTLFPNADSLGEAESHGGKLVLSQGKPLGSIIQTSPEGDRFLGFSGPTNSLIGFDEQGKIVGITILSSRDTREHVSLIRKDPRFLQALNGKTTSEAANQKIDAVSGATLTSLAILQGIQARLGKAPGSLKFPESYTLEDARRFFPAAIAVDRDPHVPELWLVTGEKERPLGWLLSNSPIADETIGYQGPTRAHLGMHLDGKILGLVVEKSFDNEPYVGYVRGDSWFAEVMNEKSLDGWGKTSWKDAGIDGVSGATMTSQAVAEGLLKAAHQLVEFRKQEQQDIQQAGVNRWKTITTSLLIALGIAIGSTRLRQVTLLRRVYQLLLIVLLGFINGDLLSMAMFVGWSRSGIPFKNALGLFLLSAAAIILPVVFKQNTYCDHLCPHGAVQQLLPRRWKLRNRPRWLLYLLKSIRPVLLGVIVLTAMLHWNISLVDLEPFDAYAWRAAGIATISIAVGSILLSLWIPMGYCQYGCPTGAVLGYLRRHSRSDRFTRADGLALALLALSLVCLGKG